MYFFGVRIQLFQVSVNQWHHSSSGRIGIMSSHKYSVCDLSWIIRVRNGGWKEGNHAIPHPLKSKTYLHMPHQISILSSFLFHISLSLCVSLSVSHFISLSLSCIPNKLTKGTPPTQSLNWGSSGQIMIVNGKKPNHLSQSLISPVPPDFLLLLYLQ